MTSQWVLLTKLNEPLQAELLRGLLEAQEIEALLAQEGAAKAMGISVGTLGEIDVMVPKDQLEAAQGVMDEFFGGEFEEKD